MTIAEQCRVLGLPRSEYYRKRGREDAKKVLGAGPEEAKMLDEVLAEWSTHSAYGYQKMSRHMQRRGFRWATEFRIRKAYAELGIRGQVPEFRTTRPDPRRKERYPYLLRGRTIMYANEAWATDITYIRLCGRMVYFTAIIDLYSRKILTWRLSEGMGTGFCMDALQEAIERYGTPAIVNTDQGRQYTSKEFISMLKCNGIRISMDGAGRCKDNIFVERTWRTLKYEWLFLREYECYEQLEHSLGQFVEFFNGERIHQSLGYMTPDEVYSKGTFQDLDNIGKDMGVA